jgi:3-oxoacyl-[acyl-carrier-protein] synthase I
MNRVVITGIGIYSTIGKNLSEVKQSLYEGKSGIVFDQDRKNFGYRSALTGYIEKPELKGILDRRARVNMAEQGEYAYLSTIEAIKNAGIDEQYVAENNFGIIFGNDSSTPAVIKTVDIVREKKDTTYAGSGAVFQSMNSTVSMNLSVILKIKGVNFTLSGACASGSHSIGMSYLMIKHGYQDRIICGGAQEINIYCVANFDALSAFSTRESEPTKASRPFDKNRDGLVPSGGAATLILESYESAVKRGAPIIAEIFGYGFSSDGNHISVPDVDGPMRAINMALEQSGISPDSIEYVNAHATSTPLGDANEAKALDAIFGKTKPLVSSTKSMTGHEMWMAGASEVVYSLLMMQNGFIAPNINFEEPDEFSAKLNIASQRVDKNFSLFLSNSFGFGGTNSSLIIGKPKINV